MVWTEIRDSLSTTENYISTWTSEVRLDEKIVLNVLIQRSWADTEAKSGYIFQKDDVEQLLKGETFE